MDAAIPFTKALLKALGEGHWHVLLGDLGEHSDEEVRLHIANPLQYPHLCKSLNSFIQIQGMLASPFPLMWPIIKSTFQSTHRTNTWNHFQWLMAAHWTRLCGECTLSVNSTQSEITTSPLSTTPSESHTFFLRTCQYKWAKSRRLLVRVFSWVCLFNCVHHSPSPCWNLTVCVWR